MHLKDSTVIPPNIAALMTPETRASIGAGAELPVESETKYIERVEGAMHKAVIQYCNLKGVGYVHAQMNKKSTIKKGHPDFTCYFNGKVCFLEMKIPGRPCTPEQINCIAEIGDVQNCPVLVARSSQEAIDFIRKHLL